MLRKELPEVELTEEQMLLANLPLQLGGLGLSSATSTRFTAAMASAAAAVQQLLRHRVLCHMLGIGGQGPKGGLRGEGGGEKEERGEGASGSGGGWPGLRGVQGFEELAVYKSMVDGLQHLQDAKARVAHFNIPLKGKFGPKADERMAALPKTVDELLRLASTAPGGGPHTRIQQAFSTAHQRVGLSDVFNSTAADQHPRLVSQMQAGAKDWLMCAPFETELRLNQPEFVWSVVKHLGKSTPQDEVAGECAEVRSAEQKRDHVDVCKIGGGLIHRHDAVVSTVARIAKLSGLKVAVEERASYEGFGNGGPDLTVDGLPEAGHSTFVEVSITSPTIHGSKGAQIPLYAAEMRHMEKHKKYKEASAHNGKGLWPVVFESTGAQGKGAVGFVKKCVKLGTEYGREPVFSMHRGCLRAQSTTSTNSSQSR